MKSNLFFLLILLSLTACNPPQLQQEVATAQQQIDSLTTALAAAEALPNTPNVGFIHSVFFWMKEGNSEEAIAQFEKDLRSLGEIKDIIHFHIGKPAGSERAVVDNSYDYALIIHFPDIEAESAYQVDPIHTAFVENNNQVWSKVKVYDTLTE